MKKISCILIILSSMGIITGETLCIMNPSAIDQKIVGVSFIGLGVGAILLGLHVLNIKHNKT